MRAKLCIDFDDGNLNRYRPKTLPPELKSYRSAL